MTITYPRDLPDAELEVPRCQFHYETLGEVSRTRGGMISFQEAIGGSLWELSITTKPLNETDYSRWHAWYLSLRGGAQSFRGYDPRRCYPLAYGPDILTMPGAGVCRVSNVTGETISLDTLPVGYQMRTGDYVSFDWLGGRALVKALEDRVSNSAGEILNIAIAPWQRTGGLIPVANALLVRAWCLMRPKPGSWVGSRAGFEPVSFEAIQTFA